MRLLVCGSRTWADRERIRLEVETLAPRVVLHGAALGADTIAMEEARGRNVETVAFPADWRADGKLAGPIRNARMLADGRPDRGLAFGALWRLKIIEDHSFGVVGGRDVKTGTGDMVSRMLRAGLPVRWIAAPDTPAMDLTEMPRPTT